MSTFITANTSDDVILSQFLCIPIDSVFCDITSISKFLIGDLRVRSHQSDDFLRSFFSFLRSFSTSLRSCLSGFFTCLRSFLRSTYRCCFRSNRNIIYISSRQRLIVTTCMYRDVDKERQTVFCGLESGTRRTVGSQFLLNGWYSCRAALNCHALLNCINFFFSNSHLTPT